MSKRVTIMSIGFIVYAAFQVFGGPALLAFAFQLWQEIAAGKWGDVQRLLSVLGS